MQKRVKYSRQEYMGKIIQASVETGEERALLSDRIRNTVAHTTILRWVLRYIPEYEKRWGRFARPVGTSWRVDETYISIRGRWHQLYRAVDKHRKTIA